MKQKYRMSEEQFDRVMKACEPVRYMVMGGMPPSSPQENANRVWREVAGDFGVEWDSIEDAGTGDPRDFLATPMAAVK